MALAKQLVGRRVTFNPAGKGSGWALVSETGFGSGHPLRTDSQIIYCDLQSRDQQSTRVRKGSGWRRGTEVRTLEALKLAKLKDLNGQKSRIASLVFSRFEK